VIASRQQAQALRRLVEQLGLWQGCAGRPRHGVGGEDISALEFFVGTQMIERGLACARQPIGAGARQFAPLRGSSTLVGRSPSARCRPD